MRYGTGMVLVVVAGILWSTQGLIFRQIHDAGTWATLFWRSVGMIPVNFDALGCDSYAFSGHKLGGPMGIGGLLGRKALLETMPPYQTGGDMIESVGDQVSTWNTVPFKFEAGTPNAADAVGLAACMSARRNNRSSALCA